MTDAEISASSRVMRRTGIAVAVLSAATLGFIASQASGTIGQVLFGSGAVMALLLLVGRWTPLHGTAAALVAVLLLQPILAQALTPIRHLTPNGSYVIQTEVPGIRNGSVVTIDERGFRPTSVERPTDPSRRIVLIGGSTFEQIYVDDRATTGWLLAERLTADGTDDVEVINTGLSGLRSADHLVHLSYFERDADRFDDTHYVIMMGINDWNRHVRDLLGVPPGLPAAAWRRVEAYPLVRVGIDLRRRMLPAESQERVVTYPQMGKYDERPKFEVSDEQLAEMLERCRESIAELSSACDTGTRTRCTFVTQPTVYRRENFASDAVRRSLVLTPSGADEAMGSDSLIRVARAFNESLVAEINGGDCTSCAVVDADEALGGRPELFYDDCHFTEAGANVLADTLISGGVLSER